MKDIAFCLGEQLASELRLLAVTEHLLQTAQEDSGVGHGPARSVKLTVRSARARPHHTNTNACGSIEEVGTLFSSLGFCLCFFISRLGHDLSDCPARSAKLDGDHSWIADQFAAELLQVSSRLLDIVDLDRKMMDARSEP